VPSNFCTYFAASLLATKSNWSFVEGATDTLSDKPEKNTKKIQKGRRKDFQEVSAQGLITGQCSYKPPTC
jgi:hypothetical protein